MNTRSVIFARQGVLPRIGTFVAGLRGWRRCGFAFIAGLLSALAFAPFGIFPLLLLAFAVLVLLLDGARQTAHPLRSAAAAGWWLGFGQFLAGLYWVGYAFMVDPASHGWQMPFAVVLLCGGLAFFPAGAAALAGYLWRPGMARIFILAASWAGFEWLRGHVFTGFPWNLAAYGWGALPAILQSASVIGAYGLTLLTALLGASFAEFFTPRRRAYILPAGLSALFVLIWVAGAVRLATPTGDVPGVALRIVQPDVPQREKYERRYIVRNWQRLISLSIEKGKTSPTDIIWPEAAPPFLLQREPEALDDIAVLTANKVLITGAQRAVFDQSGNLRFYNSVYMFAHGGKPVHVYDKFHLVPFGEYVPFAQLLASMGVTQLAGSSGFTPGDGPHTYDIPGAPPVGPLVCYEVLFPGAVVGERRPEWFVNVTDDSWFGPSTGPYQHLLTAQVRAIEEGIPIVRDANTGISAVIDPLGRITAKLGLDEMGAIDARLPRALPPTLYARFGGWSFLLILVLIASAAIYTSTREG